MALPIKGFTNQFANRAAAETGAILVTGQGYLGAVVINKGGAAFTITLYDGTDALGTVIASLTLAATTVTTLRYNCMFKTGLFLVSAGASHGDFTIMYQKS